MKVRRQTPHEAGFVRRIDDAAAIQCAHTHRDPNSHFIISAQRGTNLCFIVSASIRIVGVDGRGDTVGDHIERGERCDRMRIKNPSRPTIVYPQFEKIVAVTQLNLAYASAVLMRVHQARRQETIWKIDQFGVSETGLERRRLADCLNPIAHHRNCDAWKCDRRSER
jgi:hypothetical protein